MESKPEGNRPDLRISQPWPELLEYCRSIDLDKQVKCLCLCFPLSSTFLISSKEVFLITFSVGVPGRTGDAHIDQELVSNDANMRQHVNQVSRHKSVVVVVVLLVSVHLGSTLRV